MTAREFIEAYGSSHKSWNPIFTTLRQLGLIAYTGHSRSAFVEKQRGGSNVCAITDVGKTVLNTER